MPFPLGRGNSISRIPADQRPHRRRTVCTHVDNRSHHGQEAILQALRPYYGMCGFPSRLNWRGFYGSTCIAWTARLGD